MYWYAGKQIDRLTIELNVDDPGLLFGATVFTSFGTARLSESTYALHCQRLRSSIVDLGWCEPDWPRLERGVKCLQSGFPVLRITIFPDGRELIAGRTLPPQLATQQTLGVTAIVAAPELKRSLPTHKTGNYLAPWLALQQARHRDFEVAILTNERGDWLETATGNLWGYREGCWYTPPVSAGILPGIERAQILTALHQQHRAVAEVAWTSAWVERVEALGYSNSVVGFVPIHAVTTAAGTLTYDIIQLRT